MNKEIKCSRDKETKSTYRYVININNDYGISGSIYIKKEKCPEDKEITFIIKDE